ncbi:heat shock 70 kDa protein 16 [Rutidosis leptorrhynchoides]|uniref:heat shock 70 kDa protein 16 n=1 Tax=Rutidosis leptorrhynchoides TaxID=125765 RepID=UPI003A99B13D
MSVVGFDIGNENLVIAAARNRGIDVLLNDESKRETPAIVSFGEKQRFLGSAGAASATMNPRSTISQVKRLIGSQYKNLVLQDHINLLPFETSEADDGGVLIHLQYMNERRTFTPVQILGMLFAHLKQMAEKNLESPVSDCVIGIPSYFTDLQRRAYLDAADIAGLKPLRLIHDGTAIALGYGIYKNDFADSGPTSVVFVDIGHCDTQVTVAAFENGHMKVLSHSFDNHLGGRDFDEVLFKYFVEKFKQQYNIDVNTNTRACVRLRTACEKLKKVLSANAEAPINIECLMDETDVKGFIKREDFENLCSDLLERVSVPCFKAVNDAGIDVDKIYAIELVGSGSRIPAIMRRLTHLFKREPRRTLNASECVARGCALQCAMLSPTFRVRDYEVQDSFPFAIGLLSDDGTSISLPSGALFPKGHPFPSAKIISLHRNKTFRLVVVYANESDLPVGVSPNVSHYTIAPISSAEKVKVKVKFHLNIHGIVRVESASVIAADHSSNNSHSHSEPMVVDNHMSNGAADHKFADPSQSTAHSADETRKSKYHKQNIKVSESVYGGTTRDALSQAQLIERELANQDIYVEQTKEKKNNLESFVYDTRNKLLSSYRSFATDEEKDRISRNLQETEDWLYEDGDDESQQTYTRRLEDLRKLVDPIESRYKEEDARAQATKNLSNSIKEYCMAANSLSATDKEAVYSECSKIEQWLNERSQLQASLPKNADPELWSHEINKKAEVLHRMFQHITKNKYSAPSFEDSMDSNERDKPDDMYED